VLNTDLIDSSARVIELSRLVSELPPHNYALLRALTAHLILIVENASANKMTLRNIGIVFSPTLGIPAGIFSELVSHFGPIFDDDPPPSATATYEGGAGLQTAGIDVEETVRRKRNSMLYQAGGIDAMLGLGGRSLDPGEFLKENTAYAAAEDTSGSEHDDNESETHSFASREDVPVSPPMLQEPSIDAARRTRSNTINADPGVSTLRRPVDPVRSHSHGLSHSPRPGVVGQER
jgi:RalA-binding protein 1